MLLIGDDDGRSAVREDVADLIPMETSVDRHGDKPGVPDRIQGLEVLRPVPHHERDPGSGREAETIPQAGGRAGSCGGELGPRGVDALAVGQSRLVGPSTTVAREPAGEVHPHGLRANTRPS